MTNKVVFSLNLSTIEKYIKNVDSIDLDDIMMSRLPQLESYLKILGILYLIEDTNISINFDIVMLQAQVLRVGQVDEPCIRLTQENLIENSVQNCLLYILRPHGLCYSTSSLP